MVNKLETDETRISYQYIKDKDEEKTKIDYFKRKYNPNLIEINYGNLSKRKGREGKKRCVFTLSNSSKIKEDLKVIIK